MESVSTNRIPRDSAAVLNRFLFIVILVLPYWGERSSDVTRRIIAVTAIKRFRSKNDMGRIIWLTLNYAVSSLNFYVIA